jgi:hypothetical protein
MQKIENISFDSYYYKKHPEELKKKQKKKVSEKPSGDTTEEVPQEGKRLIGRA